MDVFHTEPEKAVGSPCTALVCLVSVIFHVVVMCKVLPVTTTPYKCVYGVLLASDQSLCVLCIH